MNHYFNPDPNLPHKTSVIHYRAGIHVLKFITDAGVFSKQKVDYGSNLLVKALPPLEGEVLDLGCGYGPIGISLAVLNPQIRVTMVDINKRAAALAKENIHINGVKNARVLESNGFAGVSGQFNAIVCNPPIRAGKRVIYPLFEKSINFLLPGGSLWLVIQKKQGAASALAKLEEIFSNCLVMDKSGGYWILKSCNI